jgi:hypothetical protein
MKRIAPASKAGAMDKQHSPHFTSASYTLQAFLRKALRTARFLDNK